MHQIQTGVGTLTYVRTGKNRRHCLFPPYSTRPYNVVLIAIYTLSRDRQETAHPPRAEGGTTQKIAWICLPTMRSGEDAQNR